MKKILLIAALLAALPTLASSNGYFMGLGRASCGEVLTLWQGGKPIDRGQIAGWVLGFWSHATTVRETGFVDTIEAAGGERILTLTLDACAKAQPDTPLFRVALGMIANTK